MRDAIVAGKIGRPLAGPSSMLARYRCRCWAGGCTRKAPAPAGAVTLLNQDGEVELPLVQEDYYVRGTRAFHAAIHGEGRPAVTGEDGLRSLAVALAARRSAQSGQAEAVQSL